LLRNSSHLSFVSIKKLFIGRLCLLCRLDYKVFRVKQRAAIGAQVVELVRNFLYRSEDFHLMYDGAASVAYDIYKHME
jgi:hypothetical protein